MLVYVLNTPLFLLELKTLQTFYFFNVFYNKPLEICDFFKVLLFI